MKSMKGRGALKDSVWRAQSGTTLLEIALVLWLSPLLLISLMTMTQVVSQPDQEQMMEEELFFHTIERLMWRSISCEKVGEEVHGVDVDPEEEPVKWRLVRINNQIRLKKEFGGELTYAHGVDDYQVRQDGQTLVFELNQRQRIVQCKKAGSS